MLANNKVLIITHYVPDLNNKLMLWEDEDKAIRDPEHPMYLGNFDWIQITDQNGNILDIMSAHQVLNLLFFGERKKEHKKSNNSVWYAYNYHYNQ